MFTCGGRRVALLKAFRDAMAELGLAGRLYVTDVTDTSPAYYAADEGLIVPQVGTLDYIPAVLRLVERLGVRLIVPLTDLDLRSLARQQDKFQQLGCTVMVGTEEAVTLCRDKTRINDTFERAGVKHIQTCTLAEFHKAPFFPCFVKPTCGSASVGAAVVNNGEELKAHVTVHGDQLIVQQYIHGPEYTIDIYRTRAGQVKCVVPRQRLLIRSGEVEKGVTVKDEALIADAARLAGQVEGLWGVFCCQCKRDQHGVARFFEVNARFGGGATLSIAAGANLPLYLIQDVLGMPVTAQIGNFTDRLLMMRYDQAVFRQVEDPSKLPGYRQPFGR